LWFEKNLQLLKIHWQMTGCRKKGCPEVAQFGLTRCHYDHKLTILKNRFHRCKDSEKKAKILAQRVELKSVGKKKYNKQQVMVMQAEVNALMDREEAKDVISPETPEVHNPVKDLNLFQRNSPFKEYFTDCRMTPDGDFAVSDVIQKFKGSSHKYALEILQKKVGPETSGQLKKYKFRRGNNALGPAIPVGSFNVIIEILSQLSGKNAQILRREQADIATMVREGKRAEVNALMDRKEARSVIVPATPEVHNPVKDLNLMNFNVEDFKDIRQEKGYFCVYDAIAQFKNCSTQRAMNIFNSETKNENSFFIKMVQFERRDGRMGRAVPCCTFKDLVQVLSQLPGQAGKILRREQAEIATMVREGKRAEVNALMDREEAKDVISPETPEVHNPVKDLNLFQRNSPFKEYFTDCRMTPDGDFAVSDVIQKFKGCTTTSALKIIREKVAVQFEQQLKRYQFRRKNNALGPAIPVGSFNVIIEILSQLSGKNAQILRREQAEIATRAIAGDEALEEAVRDQRDVLPEAAREVLMQGLQTGVIRELPTPKRPISPSMEQKVIKRQKTDLTGFGFKGVVIEGGIDAQLMQSLIKLQSNQLELQKEKTKQLTIEGKVNYLKIEKEHETKQLVIEKEHETKRLNKEHETKQLKIATQGKIDLAKIDKDKVVELKKLKLPSRRNQNALTPSIMQQVWEAKHNEEFIGKCEDCKNPVCVLSVKFLVNESKQSLAEMMALDNLYLTCGKCAKKSDKKCLNRSNRNKKRYLVWLRTNGATYQEACFCCRTTLLKLISDTWEAGHVQSHSQGGSNDLVNLRPICMPCNSEMATQNMDAFIKSKGYDACVHPGEEAHSEKTTEKMYKNLIKNLVVKKYSRGNVPLQTKILFKKK
jgi:hypothetical protein